MRRGHAPWAGAWSLPGGRVEFGERLEDAARREMREETGVALEAIELLRLHESIDPGHDAHAVIAVFRSLAEWNGAVVEAADDADEARFFPSRTCVRWRRKGARRRVSPPSWKRPPHANLNMREPGPSPSRVLHSPQSACKRAAWPLRTIFFDFSGSPASRWR